MGAEGASCISFGSLCFFPREAVSCKRKSKDFRVGRNGYKSRLSSRWSQRTRFLPPSGPTYSCSTLSTGFLPNLRASFLVSPQFTLLQTSSRPSKVDVGPHNVPAVGGTTLEGLWSVTTKGVGAPPSKKHCLGVISKYYKSLNQPEVWQRKVNKVTLVISIISLIPLWHTHILPFHSAPTLWGRNCLHFREGKPRPCAQGQKARGAGLDLNPGLWQHKP